MGDLSVFRAALTQLLNIRCTFPVSDHILLENEDVLQEKTIASMYDKKLQLFIARCMKEKLDNPTFQKEFIEDIVTRIRIFMRNTPEDNKILLEVLKYLSQNLFGGAPIIELPSMSEGALPPAFQTFTVGSTSHPGITRAYKLIHTENKVFIFHNFAKHSLLSISRFHSNTTLASGMLANTTGVGCKDLRLRFIIYQLLHAVSFLHSKGFCLESLNPCDIMLDDEMWIYLPVGLSNRLLNLATLKIKKKLSSLTQQQLVGYNKALNPSIPRPVDYYEPITIQWIRGKVTNFEYLMAINFAAGRTMVDPLYHPILPWVTDFTSNCLDILEPESFRDLSKTKFRLSKGDTQLETTFRHSDPPHHIPESLSELTYYIYLARRTPMQVLRRVVRDVFVPEHYPQSMHRIYEWTPDECIPEFYMDTSVFTSIHKNVGLTDLDVPNFTTTAEEFINYHRKVLESDYVSQNLHLWIDLTFGYCLEGEAAIEHMNVPLHHTLSNTERQGLDSPRINKNPGFVMLFDQPHPLRQIENPAMQSHIYNPPLTQQDENGKSSKVLSAEAFYAEDNEKYKIKPIYLGDRHDYEGLEEYIGLDRESQTLSKLFRSYQRDSQLIGGKESSAPITPVENVSQRKSTRRSLLRAPVDPTLTKFRYLDDIDLINVDGRGYRSVNNFLVQTDHYKFTDSTTTFLDGSYVLPELTDAAALEKDEKKVNQFPSIRNWDDEFAISVAVLEEIVKHQAHRPQLTDNAEENDGEALNEKDLIAKSQAQDLFALGCMIAELYNGRSLLSENDTIAIAAGQSFDEYMEKVYKRTNGMPLILQRLISLLIYRNPSCRPHAREIIETCIVPSTENSSSPPEDYLLGEVLSTLHHPITTDSSLQSREQVERFARIRVLSESCNTLFPDYFPAIYRIIAAIKLAPDGLLRLNALLNHVDEISSLPIDGINLGLVHFFEVIGDSEYFTDTLQEKYSSSNIDVKTLLLNYWRIVDVIGLRLGVEGAEKLLVPHLVKFLNTFTSTELLRDLLNSSLWNIIALRAGVRCFLRSFLPILLTYLSAGTIHHVLIRKAYEYQHGLIGMGDNIPLWTTSFTKMNEKDEWLKKSSILAIHRVQRAAVTAISNLSESDALGSGICARYIIPSLLSLVGVPQLASSGFEPRKAADSENASSSTIANAPITSELSEKVFDELVQLSISNRRTLLDSDRPSLFDINRVADELEESAPLAASLSEKLTQIWLNDKSLLEAFIMKHATFNAEHMYVVKVIVEMGTKLGDVVISELILSNIMNITLPELEAQLTSGPKQGTAAALMEIILLLNGLLPILSPETIHHDLLQPSRLSGSSIPRLLSIWPLAPAFSFLDDLAEDLIGQFNLFHAIENVRMHTVLLELCRLIVSMSMIVGPDLTSEYVLPHLDNFFKNFVSSYGIFPVESKTMLKSFELGAEIYLPLVQIVSVEAFYTAVPNLNPRLELWLRGIGSNIPPKSPPLPSNIWPEVTNEVTSRPEKKKPWIVQFFRGLSSSSSTGSTSSNSNANSTATASATPATVISNTANVPITPNNPPAMTSMSQRVSLTHGASLLASLTKSKSTGTGVPNGPPGEELQESQMLTISGIIENTPVAAFLEARQLTPTRLRKTKNAALADTLSPTNGTELVEFESESRKKDTFHVSSTDPVVIEEKGKKGKTKPGPSPVKAATLPAISVSVLALDDTDAGMQQGIPFRKRRTNSRGLEVDDTHHVKPEAEEEEDADHFPDSDTSVDSDDEEEGLENDQSQNDLSVVVMDDEPVPTSPIHPLIAENENDNHEKVKARRFLPMSPNSPMDENLALENQHDSIRKLFPDEIPTIVTNLLDSLPPVAIDPAKIAEEEKQANTIDNSLMSPRILFSNQEENNSSAIFTTELKVERRSLDDTKCPFRRYQRLLNQRAALKNQRYASFRESPAKLRILSRRNSTNITGTGGSSRNLNPNANLSSNSNFVIINSAPTENESTDEIEFREARYSELSWLLAGYGRWNVDKEMKDRLLKEQNRTVKNQYAHSSMRMNTTSYYNSANEWNPAAQISMTAPKIAVDVANDSSTLINFQLQANTQWKLEDAPGLIKCMVTNANESLLMTCSKTGVRLFSLSTHPILHVSSYTNHSAPPFNAAFLRDGQHAMTCDGSIHLWDIESRQPLGIIIPNDKQIGYSSASVIASRYGIHPSIDSIGDEQILATISDTLSYFDIRCNYSKPMNRVAEWILPQIPPLQGNFISSTVEPLQLTCAYSHENYVFAGSATGGLYIVERRMGKLLNSWQAHDGPIIKINALSERHVLAVSERSAAIWEYLPEVSHTTYPMSSLYPGTFSVHAYNKSIHNTPIAYHEFRDLNTTITSTAMGNNSNQLNNNQTVSLYHMGYGGIGDVKKILNIKNPADSFYAANNIVLTSFDNISPSYYNGSSSVGNAAGGGGGGAGNVNTHASVNLGSGGVGGIGGMNGGNNSIHMSHFPHMNKYAGIYENSSRSETILGGLNNLSANKAQKVLYCLSGHRMHSGFLPSLIDMSTSNGGNNTFNRRMSPKDVFDCEDLKLSTNYFLDRKGNKLSRSKIHITSSVLLPLRRLLLIASEDGFVRVIS